MRSRPSRGRLLGGAAFVALALALAGCIDATNAAPTTSPAGPPASASATPSAEPTPTEPPLSPEEQAWAAERQAQLAIAAGFADSPAPVGFDVVAADEAHADAALRSGRTVSYAGTNYVLVRWSMGGKRFPGVGGLVRFSGSVSGLYRVTSLLGEVSRGNESSYGPYQRAWDGLAYGAYDAAFQTSWNGSESTIRIWVLMRVGD